MRRLLAGVLLVLPLIGSAQITTTQRRSVRATGEAEVSVRPDQARINLSVVTQANTADEASQQNATRTTAVIDAVRALIGTAGEVRTAYYNVSPIQQGNPPRITGYTVTNSLTVIANNLSITGRIIDAAITAGANRIDGLSLGLRDDEPIRQQALRAAGLVAKARAEAIAGGLGVRLGGVLSAEQTSGVIYPANRVGIAAGAAPTTPVEPGTLTVTASVTVEYEILQ